MLKQNEEYRVPRKENYKKYNSKAYTKEQMKFICNLRNKGKTYKEIAAAFNKEYKPDPKKTEQAIKDAYYAHGDFDHRKVKMKNKYDKDKLQAQFVEDMGKVCDQLGKEAYEVTEKEFLEGSSMGYYPLKVAGGFANLKKIFFPAMKDPAVTHGSRLMQSHRNKLEKWYGLEKFMSEEVLKTLDAALKENKINMHPPVKKAIRKKKKKKSRTIFAHLSDTHYGANIHPNEVGGINKYDWEVAARRTAIFVDQIVNYKPHYREDTDLILGINGDIIAGMIHDQEWFADLLTTQFVGTLDILTQAVSYLATQFRSVTVECSSGNHGRAMHKTSKQRATTHKWDSYETMIYSALKRVIESKHKNVKVNVPKTPFNIIDVHGHKLFMTHGD
ncbi:MAG: hypothetical protein R3213_13045, partial [Flavobacteriaceae bacterium]|nr:hypothetical protein [Flavobacteriaceae bacterium]